MATPSSKLREIRTRQEGTRGDAYSSEIQVADIAVAVASNLDKRFGAQTPLGNSADCSWPPPAPGRNGSKGAGQVMTLGGDRSGSLCLHPDPRGLPVRLLAGLLQLRPRRPRDPNGIEALVKIHESHAGGGTEILFVDDNLYIMQRGGFGAQLGLILVLNNRGDSWQGKTVSILWPNRRLSAAAWWSATDPNRPVEKQPPPTERSICGRHRAGMPSIVFARGQLSSRLSEGISQQRRFRDRTHQQPQP
jgi:hypothetical protein